MADKKTLDFTNVREGGGQFTKKRLPAGDYLAKVTKVENAEIKKGENKGKNQWLFTIAVEGRHGASYPFYCQFAENQLWKIRNLLVAAGKSVPKKRVAVDPKIVVGKRIGITLDDAEYDDREQSEITAVFPPQELQGDAKNADVDDEDEDEDEDEEDEAPTKKSKKSKAADEDEEDEDEDEDEEEEKPKKKKRSKTKDDDDEDTDTDELDIEDL